MEHYLRAISRLESLIPATLYHYCSVDKLRYLLEPGADLCCRYLTCQGDSEEYRFGAKMLCDYIRRKGLRYDEAAKRIESSLVENIEQVGVRFVAPQIPLTFSLTEQIDSEYHYKEYCANGGCAIAFSQQELDVACDRACARGVSLRLIRCYYKGKDRCAIKALCEAFWNDQIRNIDRLIDTDYRDEEAGRFVLGEICSIAPHFKRGKYSSDNEWRIVMISPQWTGVDGQGFLASGLRADTAHGDLLDLLEGIAVKRCSQRGDTLCELSRFALQQRNREIKVWI